MMLNPMAAGRPEPQWTQYQPGTDFEDCEYRTEEIEILGLKQNYIIIRGTISVHTNLNIDMPEGIELYDPFKYFAFAIEYVKRSGDIEFYATNARLGGGSSLDFDNVFGTGSRFVLFARIQ